MYRNCITCFATDFKAMMETFQKNLTLDLFSTLHLILDLDPQKKMNVQRVRL